MFDLTQQVILHPKLQKKYVWARAVLHVVFLLGILLVANRILFPSDSLDLFFDNINSTKNTIVNPRLADGKVPPKGVVGAADTFTFNANPLGNFSSATITLKTDSEQSAEGASFLARKSYQAFFYPVGQPVGFKNGSLVTTPDGNYYLISNGLLRRFANTDIILGFGFPKDSFALVDANSLRYNNPGPDITSANTYPDDSLFFIDDKYYQLKNGRLLQFVSSRAFLSQYRPIQAIAKNKDFFNSYPTSESALGFSNGTLASAGGSVFILSDGKSFPVADFNTFVEMGFSWDDVIALESDELGLYEQQKQFTHDQPHPDGTIFVDKEKNKYFMIDGGKKNPILGSEILKTYLGQKPIPVNEQSLETRLNCSLKKQILRSNTFVCTMPLDEVSGIIGNDYQFEAKFGEGAKIKQINLNFSTPLTWSNFTASLSKIKENLKNNYTK